MDGRLPSQHSVRDKPIGRAFGLDLFGRFSEGERLGLREDVRQQQIVMPPERVERLSECDEIARNEPRALMDQLIEGVLAIGSGLAPVDRAGLVSTGVPASVTCLPLLSIVNCWR